MRTITEQEQKAAGRMSMPTQTQDCESALDALQQHRGQILQSSCNCHTIPALRERADMVVKHTFKQDLACYHTTSVKSKRFMPGHHQTEQSGSPKAKPTAISKAAEKFTLYFHDSLVNNNASISAHTAAGLQLDLHPQLAASDLKHAHGT